ncbi:MAG: ATP-binding protein, partial [Candidatus Marinimicrobia bacterium]|nr:ATP-binding protein [Candidatus Neomarinimicrobiota bacterium]
MLRLSMEKLKEWKANPFRKPLVLRGARQVGKTWLLKYFAKTEFPNYHYINFEEDSRLEKIFNTNLNPSIILNELQFYLDKPINIKTDLLIFDEIQRCPRALTSLKYFRENIPELALCAAGSLLGIYLNGESFPVGKVTFLDLHPMTFEEFLLGTGNEHYVNLLNEQHWSKPLPEIAHIKLWEMWKHYLITGGMPEVVDQFRLQQTNLFEAFQKTIIIQKDLIDTFIADISKHSGKSNAMHIERLWRNIPIQLAKSLDGSAEKFKFKDAIPGYKSYDRLSAPIDWLEKADLLIRAPIINSINTPLESNRKENRFKLYHFDIGLLSAMNNMSAKTLLNYDFGTYKGYIVENYIAQELKASGYKKLFCWEGRTSEIEFLLEIGEQVIPIEVKSGY